MTKQGYDALTHRLCVEMGWCGSIKDGRPSHVEDFIPEEGLVTGDQFAEWVILAENLDLNEESKPVGSRELNIVQLAKLRMDDWRREIHAAFIECMGASIVDASELQ